MVCMVTLIAGVGSNAAEVLYETTFADGGKDWTAINNATVSDITRRTGGKSLLIKQLKDEEADSAWLSPVLKNPGKPVKISLWGADNYDAQKDFSYSAAFEIIPCDKDGKLANNGGDWTWLPWDDKRQIPQFRHTMTKEGLLWKNYNAVKNVNGDFFRLRLCWPKAMSRGECYFTDVRIAVSDVAANTTQTKTASAANRYSLEVSTAANANLFFSDDPFKFEFLLYANDKKPIGTFQKPVIRYEITDYEKFKIASGEIAFDGATPVADRHLDPKRTQNLRLSALINDEAAKEVGREFFLNAKLIDGDKVIAEDTITYGVVNPRKTGANEYDKCRFISFAEGGGFKNTESKHEGQALLDKMGTSMVHNWDYNGWRLAQPVKGGPITIKPGPEFPKMVYCPNLEQIRGRTPNHPWGDMTRNAPDWAIIDDPFRPGCKGFEIDGYVEYIVAYIRANKNRIVQVVPSGLERFIDARTLELQRKAYTAIKKEFPDLPVGMMVWGVNAGDEGVNLILKEKLYEVSDFFDTHVYQSGVVWDGQQRLQRELKKLGIERRLISTEFAAVGGNDQLQSSRDLITSMLDAHAHDMYRITYFLMYVNEAGSNPGRDAVLRGEFPGDGFQWMQYVDRPRVADSIKDNNWGRGVYGTDQRGASLMPMMKTMAYYNFVQAVECADFKLAFQPNEKTIAYVYARDGKTICYLYMREPGSPTTFVVNTDAQYTMQDIYGRTDRVIPAGTSMVVATLDPMVLIFDKEVTGLYNAKTATGILKPIDGGLALPSIARGSSGKAVLTLPAIFNKVFTAKITATVDGTWPKVESKTVNVEVGKVSNVELPITISSDTAAGNYTFTTRIYDGETLITVLKQPLVVGEILTAQMTGIPMTKLQNPAIAVTVRSLSDTAMTGKVSIANRFFGADYEPTVMEQAYTVTPRGTTEISFPIPREQANLATSYEIRATIADKSGFTITCEDDVSFQASLKTNTPITVNGDLSDWNLNELIPIPYEKWYRGPRDPKEFSGKFYSRWDDKKLYFAAEITDNVPVVNGKEQLFWNDDNIMFCLYPWAWHMGESLNTGYYREHLGPIQGGKASFLRAGYVPSGPATPDGAEIAVKRTDTGWIYEWAYTKASLYPIKLEKGGAFRLSMSVWDQHDTNKKTEQDWGKFSWLTFSGFNSSVNALPNLWRQFLMVDNTVALEAIWKNTVNKTAQQRQAIEKFALDGTCDDAAFTAKQVKYREKVTALKTADAELNAWAAKDQKCIESQKLINDLDAELKKQQKENKTETAEYKKLAQRRYQAFVDAQKVRNDHVTPEHQQLREDINNLKSELINDVIYNLDAVPAVKTMTDAYRTSITEQQMALTAYNKERGMTTPIAYLQAQPKPYFKSGNKLPPLTRYGWVMPFELNKEFADNWGYALPSGGYLSSQRLKQLSNPESDLAKTIACMKANPGKYKLEVTCDRFDPPNPPADLWTRDLDGKLLNAQAKSLDGTEWHPGMNTVISPEVSDQYWIDAGAGRANPIAEIRKLVPVSIVLNGGEWGLGVWGFAGSVWMQDPKIKKAIDEYKAKGLSRIEYLDDKTGNVQKLIANEVKKAVPDRDLYIYYTSGGSGHKDRYWGWADWGPSYKPMRGVSDQPSIECYLHSMNTGFDGNQDLLSMSLNAIGQQLAMGDTLSYNWFWAKRYDTSMRQYRGLLKCHYIMGTLGGNAGTYNQPDFNASFKLNTVPDWMMQQMALGHVHALFSHLEDYIRNGDLVDEGKYKHIWSVEQPAYELLPKELEKTVIAKGKVNVLPMGRPFRVVARKHRNKTEWLVEAWTADTKGGEDKQYDATVNIPGAGEITLNARVGGSSYLVSLVDGKPVAKLLDPDEDNPSAGFRL